MKAGQESKTAVLVCLGRALANDDPTLPDFADSTAFALLPEHARRRVEAMRSPPKGLRKLIEHGFLRRQAKILAVRTQAIDEAVREARAPQLVILGAGLDGRAFRMSELGDVVVFEVDHPDSQREKRKRVSALSQTAREVRFVPLDFARGELENALSEAGHDPERPTTWVWEGVVMYLGQSAIRSTLSAIARRSAPGSCLAVLYHSPALARHLVGALVRWLGEPLRSAFSPQAMRSLLAEHGFAATRDRSLAEMGRALSPELAAATKVASHVRLVCASRR